MAEFEPREPYRPLIWPDLVYDLQDELLEIDQPVYIVGGAVRDALLHKPLTDLDLATPENGIRLARRIANSMNGDFFVLDEERDVGRVLLDTPDNERFVIDVARFRGDGLHADIVDRDFTINAMAVDLIRHVGLLIDPLNGEADARAKLIRRCSPQSLADDPIRSLRAVRQSVQLDMHIEPETLKDIRAVISRLPQVSAERVRDEFIKMLALENPRKALRVADALGLLWQIIPDVATLVERPASSSDYSDLWQQTLAVVEKLAQLMQAIGPKRSDHTGATFGIGMFIIQLDRYRSQLRAHMAQDWPNERPHAALLVLAALACDLDDAAATASQWAHELRLSNHERDRLVAIVRHCRTPQHLHDLSPLALHRFWRQSGAAGVDICLLAAAHYLGAAGSELDQDDWLAFIDRLRVLFEAYFERYDTIVEPPVLVNGSELMAQFDLQPGPMIGTLLDKIREAQVIGDIQSVNDALAFAGDYLVNQT